MFSNSRILLFSLILASCLGTACSVSKNVAAATGDQPASAELYKTIAHMDSLLFNAFNNRDFDKFQTLFTPDLEFYHDKGGLTNYDQTVASLKNTAANNSDLKRELVPGSLEVYPLKEYGAMQIGMHRFCHTENGKPDCGVFKFVHIWKLQDGEWKITRVVSYGH
jgi:hypothetical protein